MAARLSDETLKRFREAFKIDRLDCVNDDLLVTRAVLELLVNEVWEFRQLTKVSYRDKQIR